MSNGEILGKKGVSDWLLVFGELPDQQPITNNQQPHPTPHSSRFLMSMTSNSATLSLEAAQQLLRQFTCIDQPSVELIPDNTTVRQALLLVCEHSDYQIFGICAETAEQAIAALHTYLKALDYEEFPTPSQLEGPVYLKFNPNINRCHLDSYTGNHRGVLVSCQSAYDRDVNETFGHLPLDLWS